MAIIVILCGVPHLYKKDMNNSGLASEIKKVEEKYDMKVASFMESTGCIIYLFSTF